MTASRMLKQRRFCKDFADAADFDAVFAPLRAALQGRAEVHVAPMERLVGQRLAFVDALYDLIGMPDALRQGLAPTGAHKRRSVEGLADPFVMLNRAKLPPEELGAAKMAVPATRTFAPAAMTASRAIAENVAVSPRHKMLYGALQAAGLVERLGGEGEFTLFAPTDAAFEKLPAGQLEKLFKPENKDELRALLNYHVVSGNKSAADVGKWQNARTVNGQDAPIKHVDGKVSIDGAQVTKADIISANGVIHGIDKVNMPSKKQ